MNAPLDPPPLRDPSSTREELAYVPGAAVSPGPSERLHTLRTFIVGVVIMWVALVAAWAVRDAVADGRFARRAKDVAESRQRLASVQDLGAVFSEVNTVVEPAVVKLDVVRAGDRAGPFGRPIPEANSGSGVIVENDAEGGVGFVVTNNHVVANASRIDVTLSDGRTLRGRVIGTDADSDLAVVAVRADNLIAAEWGDSDVLRKGDWVLAFGSPFNFVGSMTAGIVSALNRTQNDGIDTPLGEDAYQNFIQVDAAVNPGNSGGPLANLRGEIIGINTAIFSRTGDFSGIGFAIPSNQARRVYHDIRQSGRFVRGWLGVGVAPVQERSRQARELGYDGDAGVIVTEVYRDTPAAGSGLRRNDIILSVDGAPVRDSQALRNRTAFAELGSTVELEVVREGATVKLPVTVGPMPDDTMLLGLQPQFEPAALGLRLSQTDDGPVQVVSVAKSSPAANAGLRPGDYLLEVEGQPVPTVEHANALLAQLDPELGIELTIMSGRRAYNVVIRR